MQKGSLMSRHLSYHIICLSITIKIPQNNGNKRT